MPSHLRDFFHRQLSEIRGDEALRWYGAAVALFNGLTALYWLQSYQIDRILADTTSPICWPLFDSCHTWRIASGPVVTLIVASLGLVSVVNAQLFIEPRRLVLAYWLLLLGTAVKVLVLLQDFRLAANQHYMATWIAAAYLFVSQRRRVIPVLITLFYFWAGTLKLNSDWLSGATLLGAMPFGMPQSWVPAACAYLILLELVQIWGLLSKHKLIFWLVFVQVVIFHLSSFWVVGYFYPVLMFLVLVILPMLRFTSAGAPSGWPRAGIAMLVMFCGLQVVPRLLSSDPAITGEGRMLALNMFDAPTSCRAEVAFRSLGGGPTPLTVPYLQPRLRCDPIVYRAAANELCRTRRDEIGDLDLRLTSKRAGRPIYATVVDIKDFCSAPPSYFWFRHNSWIADPNRNPRQ